MGKRKLSWEIPNMGILIREQGGKLKHKLLLFKKARQMMINTTTADQLNLNLNINLNLIQPNYNGSYRSFITEYQFSPESTPPVFFGHRLGRRWRRRRSRTADCLYALLLCSPCKIRRSSRGGVEHQLVYEDHDDDDDDQYYGHDYSSQVDHVDAVDHDVVVKAGDHDLLDSDHNDQMEEELDSDGIDRRAEEFILRFREQMRMQRQVSDRFLVCLSS